MTAPRRPLNEMDLLRLRAITEPQMHPRGDGVVYVRTHIDADWTYRSQLVLVDDRGERALTDGTARDRAPRWSPDGGRIAFVSDRTGSSQVHVLVLRQDSEGSRSEVGGGPDDSMGTCLAITSAPHGVVGAPAWTADGATIVFSALVQQTPPPGRPGEPAPTMRVVREIDYKQDSTYIAHGARAAFAGFRDGRRQHVFAVPAAGGAARQLTEGDYDHVAPAVSPDGRRVAFIAKRVPDADRTAIQHLWTVPVGGGAIDRVGGGWGPITDFAWSPDGTRVAFIGHLLGDAGKDRVQPHVFVVSVPEGTPRCLTEAFEPTIGVWARGDFRMPESSRMLAWGAAGITFLASWHGRAHVYRLEPAAQSDVAPEITRVLDGDRTIFSVSANDRGQLAFAAQDDVEPGDLYRFDPGQGERRLTAINAEALAGVEIVRPVHFTFEGTRGQAVDSWIVPPADAKLGERRPLIMNTHRGAHGLAFFFEFQFLAARGYGVLYCNHVGAQGYGPDYAVGQDKAWGGPDVEEMLRSIEAAAARFDFVDGARVGTTGLSAGGFYTNWLLSRTDRFKAGVSEGGIYNWLSKFGTSDIGTTYVISEMGGLPWERRDDYWRHSPLAKVDHVTAPLLIIHADEDHRCDITESEQMFRALRYLGRTVELLWVRGESHGFSRAGRPVNRIERLRRIADWFDRHL